MREFAAALGIELTHLSPGYAQSNGLAGRNVKTIKHLLKKFKQTNPSQFLALLTRRKHLSLALAPLQHKCSWAEFFTELEHSTATCSSRWGTLNSSKPTAETAYLLQQRHKETSWVAAWWNCSCAGRPRMASCCRPGHTSWTAVLWHCNAIGAAVQTQQDTPKENAQRHTSGCSTVSGLLSLSQGVPLSARGSSSQ